MSINEFISELNKKCRANGVILNKREIKIVITQMVVLIKELVFKNNKINIKNLGNFSLGKTSVRKLPNGNITNSKEIVKFKISKNLKFKD